MRRVHAASPAALSRVVAGAQIRASSDCCADAGGALAAASARTKTDRPIFVVRIAGTSSSGARGARALVPSRYRRTRYVKTRSIRVRRTTMYAELMSTPTQGSPVRRALLGGRAIVKAILSLGAKRRGRGAGGTQAGGDPG